MGNYTFLLSDAFIKIMTMNMLENHLLWNDVLLRFALQYTQKLKGVVIHLTLSFSLN